MIRGTLNELIAVTGGRVHGGDAAFQGLSTDTRNLQAGSLFVALRGPNFNASDFIAAAREAGAAAVVVERAPSDDGPALVVRDSRLALGQIARHWRRKLAPELVGITGSNGKTTVKQMLAAILAQAGETLATKGNLNNDIGVPLTLACLTPAHRYAVIEMGANHAGEIALLGEIAEPHVAIVNNAGPAHLEGFGSLDGVARAKGELFELLGQDGTAVINADDCYAPLWRELAQERRVMDFGLEQPARVSAGSVDASGAVHIRTPLGEVSVRLAVPGRHNLMNALAATAAAVALNVSLDHVRAGLEGFRPEAGRLQYGYSPEGALIINDSYNANPASLNAGLAVLREQAAAHAAQIVGTHGPDAASARPWLVLGDMAELGAEAVAMHAEAGLQARAAGVVRLYTLGNISAAASRAFGEGASHFQHRVDLLAALHGSLDPEVVVLVKGSRSMGMEHVVAGLMATTADAPVSNARISSAQGGH